MAGGAGAGASRRWRLTPRAAALRTHPIVLASLVVLIVNDHVLKARWPGPVTGLASDIAGLVLLPAAIVLALDAARTRAVTNRTAVRVASVVAFGFAAVELLPAADTAYELGLGIAGWPVRALFGSGSLRVAATADPFDLVALPAALVVPWLWAKAPATGRAPTAVPIASGRRPLLGAALVLLLAPALLATSQPAEPQIEAEAVTPAIRLDASNPAQSFLITIEGTADGPGSKRIELDTTFPHRAGEPAILKTTSLADASEDAAFELVATSSTSQPATSERDPLRVGFCERTCRVQVRVVLQALDPGDGAWAHELRVRAALNDVEDGAGDISVSVVPEPAPPAEELDRIAVRASLGPGADGKVTDALVLRLQASPNVIGQVRLAQALDDQGFQPAPVGQLTVGEVSGSPLSSSSGFLDAGTRCHEQGRPCPAIAAYLLDADTAEPSEVVILRGHKPIPGVVAELVPAVWNKRIVDLSASTLDTIELEATVEPGTTLLVGLRPPPGYDRPYNDSFTLRVRPSTSEPFDVGDGRLTTVDSCPADAPAPCPVSFAFGRNEDGQMELDLLTIDS